MLIVETYVIIQISFKINTSYSVNNDSVKRQ